jgi:hypothetical protein
MAAVDRAIAIASGSDPDATSEDVVQVKYPPKNSYPFPMYCQKRTIGGLEAEWRRCDELLRLHSRPGVRTIVVLRLDPEERIYVQCTFKKDPGAEHKFKFCDTIGTTLHRNLRTLTMDFAIGEILFVDETLRKEFGSALRRGNLAAVTTLVG